MTDTPDLQATVDKRVAQYIQIRRKLKELDDEAEAKRKPLVELQQV